jgi:hypothetical protein
MNAFFLIIAAQKKKLKFFEKFPSIGVLSYMWVYKQRLCSIAPELGSMLGYCIEALSELVKTAEDK